ncbi:MAG: 2,4-dihydroxyhept-2-ene-1,7-dioic acid aldolase [Betaproteobacteria bacterium AqS2]|uniref:2,4-dihydroxyhept-2-ene-1,7-dioic acid aldolase n=1 Tax=Candidatus Amphirhobacter heronislandensis TaxID=1732024 RepID=A0A930Y2Y5_9GAMM|nr:2,4-dihydroxyhept-2-ene-1,7-dioic acid aldolase [Betaproteobacteria bacterium AqS2]
MENPIKQRFERGEPVVNGWLAIPSFFTAEAMATLPWDSLTIDMQHGLSGYDTMLPMLAAIPAATPAMARVPWLEPGIIMKSLDAGCLGIICPMVNSGADAESFIQAMRYPPRGGRSFGPTRAVLRHGPGYAAEADANCLAFAMIETKEALDDIDAIMATDGLDAVYVGPADLANSLGQPPRLDPEAKELTEAFDLVVAKAKEHKRWAGIHTGSAAYARRMIDKGFNLVSLMSDTRLLLKAGNDELARLREQDGKKDDGGVY